MKTKVETVVKKISGSERGRYELEVGTKDKPLLKKLLQANGGTFSLWAISHTLVWAACVVLVFFTDNLLLHVAIALLLSSQLHALTILQHDCGHESAYRRSFANLWVGRFFAWFIFLPFTTFTEAHKRHHRYLGDAQQDPDEWFYSAGAKWLFVREGMFVPRFIYISLTRYGNKVRNRVLAELGFNMLSWGAIVAMSLYTGKFYEFVVVMLIPVLFLALVINPISRGYEHFPLAELDSNDERRFDLRFNTITVTNRVFGFLWANITYHVEHHMYPKMPFYNLPKLHQLMKSNQYIKHSIPLHALFIKKPATSNNNIKQDEVYER